MRRTQIRKSRNVCIIIYINCIYFFVLLFVSFFEFLCIFLWISLYFFLFFYRGLLYRSLRITTAVCQNKIACALRDFSFWFGWFNRYSILKQIFYFIYCFSILCLVLIHKELINFIKIGMGFLVNLCLMFQIFVTECPSSSIANFMSSGSVE